MTGSKFKEGSETRVETDLRTPGLHALRQEAHHLADRLRDLSVRLPEEHALRGRAEQLAQRLDRGAEELSGANRRDIERLIEQGRALRIEMYREFGQSRTGVIERFGEMP